MAQSKESSIDTVDRIRERAPDFISYENASDRLSSDKNLRLYWIKNIKALCALMEQIPENTDKIKQQKLEQFYHNTRRKLHIIVNSLATDIHPKVLFYTKDLLNEAIIKTIIKYDWAMISSLENIKDEIRIISDDEVEEDLQEQLTRINDYIDTVNQNLFEREALILKDSAF